VTERGAVARRGFAEFFVIVIGVLVALGLENWWAVREEHEQEREYLTALVDEARTNARTVEAVQGVARLKRGTLAHSQALLESGQALDSGGVFLEGLLQGSGISVVPELSDAVFQDLQSTGRLSLIRDAGLRRRVVSAYSSLEAMRKRQARWEEVVDARLHALVSRHIPVGGSRQSGPRIEIVAEQVGADAIQQATRTLMADSSLIPEMRATFRALEAERTVLQAYAFVLEAHLARLEGREPAATPFTIPRGAVDSILGSETAPGS